MTEINLPIEFKEALPILERIIEAGHEAYFVGGSVRDLILGHKIHDVDVATSAFPEEVKQIFPRTIDVGIEHGTVLVLDKEHQYEVTTFRTESTYQDYRRPDEVVFVRSLEEDLKRRDFTMNALAMTTNGDIIDLFNGIKAIEDRVIVAVGDAFERFNEDALRMMRALRFSSQLDFEIESHTKMAILNNHELLSKIAIERIYVEWVKLLMGDSREKGLRAFVETKCYTQCPNLEMKEFELMAFSKINPLMKLDSEEIAWLCLFIALGVTSAKTFLSPWKVSKKLSQVTQDALVMYSKRLDSDWTADMLYHSGVDVISLVEQARAFFGLAYNVEASLELYQSLPIKQLKDLNITGSELAKELGKTPGPWLGKLLKKLEANVLHEDIENTYVELVNTAKKEENRDDSL